jgi:hypothetical protein
MTSPIDTAYRACVQELELEAEELPALSFAAFALAGVFSVVGGFSPAAALPSPSAGAGVLR